jgi:hypothetical protein
MLMLLVLFMGMPPTPVGSLPITPQVFIVNVSLVPAFEPVPILAIFAVIPVVIILVVRIVDSAVFPLVFALALAFLVILCNHRSGIHQRHSQRRR